jgi:hypothetical protein
MIEPVKDVDALDRCRALNFDGEGYLVIVRDDNITHHAGHTGITAKTFKNIRLPVVA